MYIKIEGLGAGRKRLKMERWKQKKKSLSTRQPTYCEVCLFNDTFIAVALAHCIYLRVDEACAGDRAAAARTVQSLDDVEPVCQRHCRPREEGVLGRTTKVTRSEVKTAAEG
jgi:hypothetical protein